MRGARPERQIEHVIARTGLIQRKQRVLVACSGGCDSVALAAALRALSDDMQLDVQLAHVNHAVRNSALQDECVVAGVAAMLSLPLHVLRLSGADRTEAALRDARYAALAALAQRTNATAVAVAHHAQDQSETVLLALFRGTGYSGIAGMPARRTLADGVDVVRPLLRVAGEELRQYCHLHALPYAVDPSNADSNHRRNAVRCALTELRAHFPGLDEAIARGAEIAADERDRPVRAQLRRRVRDRLAAARELRDVDFEHVEAAVRALETGGSGTFHIKAGVDMSVTRGQITGIRKG